MELIFHYEKQDLSIVAIKNEGKLDENGQIFKKYLICLKNGKIFKKIFFKYLNVFPSSIDNILMQFDNILMQFDNNLMKFEAILMQSKAFLKQFDNSLMQFEAV